MDTPEEHLRNLPKWTQNARKYVITTTNASEVIQLNLEEKVELDAGALARGRSQDKSAPQEKKK